MDMLTDVLNNLENSGQEEEKVASVANPTEETVEDNMDNFIKEADAEGRLMAQGFLAELQEKIAVETHPVGITPDHGQIPGNINPAVQLPTAGGAVGSPATAVINSLISQAGHNGGVMQTPAGTIGAAQTAVPTMPLAADMAKAQETAEAAAKTAGDYIIESLYNLHLAG
jgi:hypothetical protein